MPRDIPVGNGDLLINFDEFYRVRDLYYPHVGRFNHTAGHVQRFGVWADGQFAWIEDPSWERHLAYRENSLVTEVRLVNQRLELEIVCNDVVDFHEAVYIRRITVRDRRQNGNGGGGGGGHEDGHAGEHGGAAPDRDVRIFMHFDLSIKESPVGDTCDFDPETNGLVFYKDDSYFLVNAVDGDQVGIDHWAIGTKRVGGAEGTWRDAEDGELGRNAISQGSVDATVGVNLSVPRKGEATGAIWLACGDSYERVRELNRVIHTKTVDRMIARTEAYWKLWTRKEVQGTPLSPLDSPGTQTSIQHSPLPPRVRELFMSSQLILRTQIDNRGAIIAATDSDISHFAGDHYAYCWPRDGALVAQALILANQSELSRNFFRFCARVINKNGYFLHKYTPAGHLASSWHPWILNGRQVLPIQQDETALVVWALRLHFETFRDVEFVKPLYNSLIAQPGEWMCAHVDENGLPRQSWDLWEERRGIHTFTVAATIGALHAAAAFASDFGDTERAGRFEEAAERMREGLLRHLWNPEASRFARMATPIEDGGKVSGYRLDMTRDSANYALFAFGAFRPGNPMVVSEMQSLWERLWVKTPIGGCARYERDYYHMVERQNTEVVPGNPWIICTLWHAQHRIAMARSLEELRAAMPLLEWTADRAKTSGVLAEQYHPYTGEAMSVSPLTWSHATVVTTVIEYLRKHERLIAEANAPAGYAESGVA